MTVKNGRQLFEDTHTKAGRVAVRERKHAARPEDKLLAGATLYDRMHPKPKKETDK